jgi:magnesium-transporting ATPase (P-type)
MHSLIRFKKKKKESNRSLEIRNRKIDEIFEEKLGHALITIIFIPICLWYLFSGISTFCSAAFWSVYEFFVSTASSLVSLEFLTTFVPNLITFSEFVANLFLMTLCFIVALSFTVGVFFAVGALYLIATRPASLRTTAQRALTGLQRFPSVW